MSKIKITALFISVLLLISFCGCGRNQKTETIQFKKSQAVMSVSAECEKDLYISKSTKNDLDKITGSEMTALFTDSQKLDICIYDVASKKLWQSLPEEYAGIKTGTVLVEVLLEGNTYVLNSQSDCVAEKKAETEKGKNYLKVTYNFSKAFENGEKINISLPVTYSLEGGTLSAEADCSAISLKGNNAIIKSISILPFFGANTDENEGDYILVPDGTGAIIDISKKVSDFEPMSFKVYGADAAKNEESEQKVLVGAFGMKCKNSAFAALIEDGAETATIKATKALKNSGYNSVSAVFEITPSKEDEEKVTVTVSKTSYSGKIRISYRFLSYENADYMGMASAIRELLIRNGSLSMNRKKAEGSYPFNLSLIGKGINKENQKNQSFTSYSQAYDILTNLKAKGIGQINVRYRGLFDGGMNQHSIEKAEVSFDSKSELKELSQYCNRQEIELFADVNLITATEKKSFSKNAVALDGNLARKENGGFRNDRNVFAAPSEIGKVTAAFADSIRKTPFQGVCLADAGNLCSDFSKGNTAFRTEASKQIFNSAATISAGKKLMVDTGNLYSVKYASDIVNLPATASCEKNEYCTRVPFISGILHGALEYSLTPINTAKNCENMFLRYVEYGAVPYFEWYYPDFSTEAVTDENCYLNSIGHAQVYYSRMAKSLSDLREERITGHKEVRNNVYLTEYEGGTKIYINYRKTPVTVNGMTVEAKSFLRVN